MIGTLERRLCSTLDGLGHERVVVAFSGGLDSTVLLHLAARARAASLMALHINHGLHVAADRWQDHCARVCDQLGVECLARQVQVAGGNLEAAARRARYRVFDELLGAGDLLLLAHHQDDQVETLLMRLLQGRGLAAMPRTRRLAGGALLLRPMLDVPRHELRRAADALGAVWVEDPSNTDLSFDRNHLRHEILPRLMQRWPNLGAALAAAAQSRTDRDALLGHFLADEPLRLSEFPRELQVPVLRAWLANFGEHGASHQALAEFTAQINARPDAQPELRLAGSRLRRWRGVVHCVRPQAALDLGRCHPLRPPGVLKLPHGDLSIQPATAPSAGFHAPGPLEVRFRQGGERIRSGAHSRSLKTLLHAAGVPPWARNVYPLVYRGGELCAVPGIAVAEMPAKAPRWQAHWMPQEPSAGVPLA